MARTSLTVRVGLDWRGVFGRKGKAATRRRGGCAAGVEPLEGRRLLSVTLVSANTTPALGAVEDNQEFAISGNGQFIVFTSKAPASDFGTGASDDANSSDVFLRNLTTGAVTLVSGTSGAARSGQFPSISADGRYVAFSSDYGGYNGGVPDTNGSNDVYVYDTQAGTYAAVSVNAAGSNMAGASLQPSISNNGRVVAFVSTVDAGTIITGVTDANGSARDVFVRNLDTGQTFLISASTSAATTTANARSEEPALSGDGNFVAFMSQATDLTAVPENATPVLNDVFRRAVGGTATDLVSVGTGSNGQPAAVGGSSPSITNDGNLVAFASSSATIVPGDTNSATDAFVRNLTQGTTQVVSTTQAGALGQGNSNNPFISANGNAVAFQTVAGNLVAPAQNSTGSDVMVKSMTDQSLTRISQTDAGEPASAGGTGVSSSFPELSADGSAAGFFSFGTNLAPGTENDADPADADLFAWRSGNVVPGDTAAPTATITAPGITAASATPQQITVVYADDTSVDASTIGTDDITVTGPGAAPLTVTSAAATPSGNAASVSVVYTVAAPGGSWDAADDGAYTVTLPANAVRDTSANGVAGATATFNVNTSGGGTGGPGADLTAAIAPKPPIPAAVIGGSKGKMRLLITNGGDTAVASPVAIRLQAVPAGTTPGAATDIGTITRPLKLKPGKTRGVALPFLYPSVPDGTYNIVATVDAANAVTESNENNNTATGAAPVTIAAPFVDLTPEVGAPTRGSLTIGKKTVVPVTISNNGNVPASGTITINLFASADNLVGSDDLPLATVTKKVKLRNGRPRPMRVSFVVPPSLATGTYFITTAIDTANGIPESDETNNTAVSSAAFQAT